MTSTFPSRTQLAAGAFPACHRLHPLPSVGARFVPLLLVVAVGLALGQCGAAAAESPAEREGKLIAMLQSEAPARDKAITCKKLAVYGSAEAVPALAPLLVDQELSSWARIALEVIPGPAADEALRAALGKVQGRLLVGVINSIGVRRDAAAVNSLVEKLKDADAQVVSAAAVALGRIGGKTAAQSLGAALAAAPAGARADVADGCIRCAEGFLAQGDAAAALKLYDTVRQAGVPKPKVLQATRGAILARGAAGLPLLVEQLRSPDKAFFAVGLRAAREIPGREVTQAVASEIERADVGRQTLLIMVLADRGDASVLPVIQKAARTGAKPMRLAAIGALERMATVACVPVLLDLATDEDRELAQPAKAALVRLPGKEINADLVARMAGATGRLRRVLVELAGQRRIGEALPAVLPCAQDADAGVRSAAIATIGIIGEEKQAGDLARLLQQAQTRRDREEIEKALVGISGRRGAGTLQYLLPLMQSSDSEIRIVALHTLASVGGPAALGAVKSALQDKDPAVQDESVRTLSTWAGNWPEDEGVAEPLLTLAKSGAKPSHQVLGQRGYLEHIQGDKKLKPAEKVARVKDLLPFLQRPEEKRQAISVVGALPTAGALELLLGFTADPGLSEEASLAIVSLAPRDDLDGASKELRQQSLQAVVDKSKNDKTRRKAETALKRL